MDNLQSQKANLIKKMQELRNIHLKGGWYKKTMCRICVKVTRNAQHQDENFNL